IRRTWPGHRRFRIPPSRAPGAGPTPRRARRALLAPHRGGPRVSSLLLRQPRAAGACRGSVAARSPRGCPLPLLLLPLVAGWADDPHHLSELLADVGDAMWRRAAVVDAVAVLELEDLAAELELDGSGEDDEQLLGIAVSVGLLSRRAADFELPGKDLEVVERTGRQEQLAAEDSERERRPLVPAQDPGTLDAVGAEQVGHRDAERVGDPSQGCDARARASAFDLAQEAL